MKKERIRKLLEYLSDGEWHRRITVKGVGAGTVNLCLDLGLVSIKRVDMRREGDIETFHIAVRITKKGKAALQS